MLTETDSKMTYIYYIPASANGICNSTVTAVQMCYQSRYNGYRNKTFGQFLLLTKSSSNFIVIKRFPLVAHMSAGVCVRRNSNNKYLCCENMSLGSSNQFNISSLDDFGFGIRNTDGMIKLLQFRNGYLLSLYQKRDFSRVSSKFLISLFRRVTASSILLRFTASEFI